MHLPSEFVVISAAEDAARMKRGAQAIEEANDIKTDISTTQTLISAIKNTHNYFNATLTPFDPKKDGSYEATNQSLKDMVYKTMVEKIPTAKADSSSSSYEIDGLLFDKFQLTIVINEKMVMNMVLLTKYYKGWDFGISYVYLDEKTKEQIETLLRTSTFSK